VARPREFDEDEAIADALQAFWKHGYASTSIPDLIAATDLERGSIYKAFGDKHSLFERALDSYLDAGRVALKECLSTADSPLAGLKAWLDRVTAGSSGATGGPGCLAVNAMVELGPSDPAIRERLARHWTVIERQLEATLIEGQTRGEVRGDIAPRQLARLIARAVAGVAVFARQGAKSDVADTVLSLVRV
jgi:TetR/AcrR family transcriptional repressor of nem operon